MTEELLKKHRRLVRAALFVAIVFHLALAMGTFAVYMSPNLMTCLLGCVYTYCSYTSVLRYQTVRNAYREAKKALK